METNSTLYRSYKYFPVQLIKKFTEMVCVQIHNQFRVDHQNLTKTVKESSPTSGLKPSTHINIDSVLDDYICGQIPDS